MRTPISEAAFLNLCKVVNTSFENWKNSSTRGLRGTFDAYNTAIRGAGAAGQAQLVRQAVIALSAGKKTKYELALDYIKFCLGDARTVNYTRVSSHAGTTVSRGTVSCLRFRPGANQAPAPPGGANANGADAAAVKNLAVMAVRIARAILYRGTLNNKVRIGGHQIYYCCRDALGQADKQAPKYLYDYNDRMADALRGDNQEDIARQMAAVAFGPWENGGAVCRMCSHVAAGVLTMLAPAGTRIAVVFDGAFDHSYAVVQRGTSPWITCDPWPGETFALPWTSTACCFPPSAVTACYEIIVDSPVSIPYGVAFTTEEIAAATLDAQRANTCKKANGEFLLRRCRCNHGTWGCRGQEPATVAQCDNHYFHPTNRHNGLSRHGAIAAGHPLAADHAEWGPAAAIE